MDTEVEIKFFVSKKAGEKLPELLAKWQVCAQNQHNLQNVYFDTRERTLKNQGIGLRVRSHDGKNEQTIKLNGSVVGGLHQRPEYNEPIEGIQPELARFKADIWPSGLDIASIQQDLVPIFSNDFTRQTWLVDINDEGLVEVAFDYGKLSCKGQEESICEVELELLKGHQGLLFELAHDMAALPGARLVNISKAQRGYLLSSQTLPELRALDIVPLSATHDITEALVQTLSQALQHWQYHEHLYLQHRLDALANMRDGVNLLHQTLLIYSRYLPNHLPITWLADLNWLTSKLKCIDRYQALTGLTQDQGRYIKKLDKVKPLKQFLKQELKSLPQYKQMKRLFTSERYCTLILAISQWLMALTKLPKGQQEVPLSDFAHQAIAQSWQELSQSALVLSDELSRSQYIALEGLLNRNLLVGACLSGLFPGQLRDEFRLPWNDILHGIEELKVLTPIYDYLEIEQDTATQEKILKWLKRKESSLLLAMEQSRLQAKTLSPYW
ncbi:CYTH domain-containing protein [Motilimonas eburnea]|uniref:CYTH and CHAD domain-containing protein n=1 Tax=Motilimonas eburnea TaxID=1737488 RepID=UPI001E63BD15|nr:CYTH domain-containing protein [Motilimonas eburnea]MCE2573491.1 CYTH domain-containing protein [Motilimonas eburnea]